MSERDKKPQLERVKMLAVAAGMLLVVFTLFVVAILAYPLFFRGRIYPGVTVRDLELGGLTTEEAKTAMAQRLGAAPARTLTLTGPGDARDIAWADLGRRYDWTSTAKAAYRVGRDGPWYRQALSAWRTRFDGQPLDAQLTPVDSSRVEALLNDLAPQIYEAPKNATVSIGPTGVTCTDGRAGRALDVEASTGAIAAAARAQGAQGVELQVTSLPPDLTEPEPGCTEAQKILATPFTVIVDDPLAGVQASYNTSPVGLAAWLSTVTIDDQIHLHVDDTAVESWLLEIAPELDPEVILNVEQTLSGVLEAVATGGHEAEAVVRHPEHTYVVQPGDTLFDIAYSHGFPVWRFEEANPEVEPGELLIGMELTIPSIDVLFPEPLAPGQRIEIDLPEQRLRAYEEDTLVYDFTCSSGMTSTPTIAGQFQVLFKEPEAYAQRWSLEMPYFMAIYYEGPDFANGIHELPIRADGQRVWASVLGWPASYGCIILDVDDAKTLYGWAPVGTLVRIKGVAPGTPSLP